MKMSMKVRFTPADVQKKILAHPEILREERYNLLDMLRAEGVNAASRAAPEDRRTLRDSLFPTHPQTFTETTQEKATIGSKLIYAGPQEDASKYTQRKKWWPPHEPIRDWVYRNRGSFGVNTEEDINRIAFFVRRKIAFQGIEPKNYLKAGLEAVIKVAPRAVELTAEKLLQRLGLK